MRASDFDDELGQALDEGKVSELVGAGLYAATLGYAGIQGAKEIANDPMFDRPAVTAPASVTTTLPPAEMAKKQDRLDQRRAQSERLTREAKILALTMWGEARNEGPAAMKAVGHVIVNRAEAERPKLFGRGIVGVAQKNKQFSCWNRNDPNRKQMTQIASLPKTSPDYKRWEQAKELAQEIIAGQSRDPTGGATYYHTTAVQPVWKASLKQVGKIGDHIFYRLPIA